MSDDQADATVVFANRHDTPLPPGAYRIELDQTLQNITPNTAPDDPAFIDETYRQTKEFVVKGDRFGLDPGKVAAVFPPSGSSGFYDASFAHVVLTRRTLPWERSPELVAQDGYSWLALLVFHGPESPAATASTVRDLTRAADGAPADVASYDDAYQLLHKTFTPLEAGEQTTDPCVTIDVPVALFQAIVPTSAELMLLAHAREVSTAKQVGGKAGNQAAPTTAYFAVVAANRLPAPGATCTAHLVSLEGMSGFLRADDNSNPPAITTPAGAARAVRLVSLLSWSFTSMVEHETFRGYLEHVSFHPPELQRPTRQPPTDTVDTAFDLGYTAMNHRTRTGDDTVSWYRGPLVPYSTTDIVPAPVAGTAPIEYADQVTRYDPTTGMFDVSYAAAWEVGRLLALSNTTYSSTLYAFKRSLARSALARGSSQHAAPRAAAAWLAANLTPQMTRNPDATEAITAPARASRVARAEARRAAATDVAGIKAALDDVVVPGPVSAFLTQLGRLSGVPFGYLVPDAEMLPTESLRFFDLDLSWVRALLEGAFSIARSSSADTAVDAQLAPSLYAAAGVPAHASGFLLRSAVVNGWPDLEVTPYDTDLVELSAQPLRMERVAPSLLLYLYPDALGKVAIHEPSQGLHFGLDKTDNPPPAWQPCKALRWLNGGPDGTKLGTQDPALTAPVSFRAQDAYTFQVRQFAADAGTFLTQHQAGAADFTSAELAVELLESADRVEFHRQEVHKP